MIDISTSTKIPATACTERHDIQDNESIGQGAARQQPAARLQHMSQHLSEPMSGVSDAVATRLTS